MTPRENRLEDMKKGDTMTEGLYDDINCEALAALQNDLARR